jgi:hypothetical protein
MGSLIMEAAYATRVPAGSALAVDRNLFSEYVTEKIKGHKNIDILPREVYNIEEDTVTVVATGPLTSDKMADSEILSFVSMLPALYAVISMLTVYFDKTYAMNSPVKIYELAMYAAMALFFVAEARCALRIPRPASYAFCGIACTVMCTVNGMSHFLVALHDTVGHGFSLVEAALWLCVALYALSRLFDFGKAAVEEEAKEDNKSDQSEEAPHAE